ncbi:hypothetical protein HK101_010977 [Irineochytrium annulatum]|nr:hypothetical protein HK101_010977 [Irineochytrium annulatum]
MTGVGAGLSSATLADEVGGTAPRAAELKAYTIPTLLDTIYAAKDLPPLPSVETAVISPRHLRPPDVNPSTAPCLITLPYELLELIASHLPPLQILRLRTLSRLAYTRCTFPSVPFATLSIARSIHEDSHRLPRLSARAIRYMKSRGAKPSGFFGLPMPCSGRVRDVVEFRKLPVSYAVSHLMSTGGLREAGMMTMGVYMTIGCSAEEARKSGWAFGMDVIRAYVGHPAAVAMDKGKELEMRVYEWVAAMDDLQLFENLMEVYSNSPVGALETAAKAGAEKIIGKVFERKGAGMPMCKGQVIPAHVARSALQAALSEGHVGIVKAIRRSYGAWIFSGVGPAGLESIMMDATSSGKVECFQELLDMSFRFVKPYTAAVAQQAAVAFHWPIVSFLWEHCQPTIRTTACRAATINGTTHTNAVTWDNLLILAAESGQDDLVRSMLSPDSKILLDPKAMNSKALSVACENGHLICAQLLLDAGADPTASHNCAVRWSAANGQAATVKLLISCDKGVDLTAEKQFAVEFAARFGRTEVLRLLLTQPEVDPSSGDGETLCAAAERGHVEAIRLLLSSGKVEPDCQNNRPLRDAISGGFADAARVLMDAMPRVDVASVCGDDVLVQAARMGHEGVVAFLLEKDVTRHAKEALSAAIEAGYSTVGTGTGAAGIVRAILAKVNVREVEGLRLIRKAVREGKADVVNALAERFDVSDKMLRWAWRVAGSALDAPMLRWILDRVRPRVAAASERTGALRLLKGGNPLRPSRDGCDGNPGLMLRMSRTRWRFDGDERRLTPLYHATRACNLEVVQLLIEGGENAHVRRGELLAVAAASQAPKVVELLLEHGLVPDGARGDGHSALVWCLNMGMTAAVKALLEKGATVQFNDCEAIKAALLKGDEDMLEVLLDHVGA